MHVCLYIHVRLHLHTQTHSSLTLLLRIQRAPHLVTSPPAARLDVSSDGSGYCRSSGVEDCDRERRATSAYIDTQVYMYV